MMISIFLGALAYVVPTFALGLVWHLFLFEQAYAALAIYRADIIIPLGLLSMVVQSGLFAWIYARTFATRPTSFLSRALAYGTLGAVLSWSFTTLAVAAKNVMSSVPDYVVIETGFTVVQWVIVAPLTVLAFDLQHRRDPVPASLRAAA
jgi:hypothetical protein